MSAPKVKVCQYGQTHSQTPGNSPLRIVETIKCRSPKKHQAIADALASAEIDHEVKVETLLYQLEVLSAKYDMDVDLVIELSNITNNLREVLDHEAPVG